nr:hypothetical protein Iba_chr04cCG14710 [Ipomoea batatas]
MKERSHGSKMGRDRVEMTENGVKYKQGRLAMGVATPVVKPVARKRRHTAQWPRAWLNAWPTGSLLLNVYQPTVRASKLSYSNPFIPSNDVRETKEAVLIQRCRQRQRVRTLGRFDRLVERLGGIVEADNINGGLLRREEIINSVSDKFRWSRTNSGDVSGAAKLDSDGSKVRRCKACGWQ